MDVRIIIRQRLKELGLEQRDLAAAAQVTESYISQLLSRKKAPPAVERTDLYERMDSFLEFPRGHLSSMAQAQRHEEMKRKLAEPPSALFRELRELIIRKCNPERRAQVHEIFDNQTFGELERLVSQTLLDVAKRVVRDELNNEKWLRGVGKLQDKSYEQSRGVSLEFLATDIFNISPEHCSAFLGPLIDSWDIDLKTFAMDVLLNKRLAAARIVRFQFVEIDAPAAVEEEPGFKEFLRNPGMSEDATGEEIAFLKSLRFRRAKPTALYYYRELQSLRDPLHFPARSRDSKAQRRSAGSLFSKKRSASRRGASRS